MNLKEASIIIQKLAEEKKLVYEVELIGYAIVIVRVILEQKNRLIGWITYHQNFSARAELVVKEFQKDHISENKGRVPLTQEELRGFFDPEMLYQKNHPTYEIENLL